MKKIYILLIMAILAIGASAQNTQTVHGAVIDKNGTPLPGAEVFATGGAETTVTDADGSFTLEVPIWLKSLTARYAGMDDKKLKTNFNAPMLFTMNPTLKNTWFINLVGGVDFGYEETCGTIGLMGGRLGKWGYYGKIAFTAGGPTIDWAKSIQATVGVIRHVYQNVYAYLGGGYAGVQDWDSYYNGYNNYVSYDYYTAGGAVEGGFIIKIGKHVNATIGYLGAFSSYDSDHVLNVGLGYVF